MSKRFLTVVKGDAILEQLVHDLKEHRERMEERRTFIKKMVKDFESEQEEHHKAWWKKMEDHLVNQRFITVEERRNSVLSLSEGLDVVFCESKDEFHDRSSHPLARFFEHIFN